MESPATKVRSQPKWALRAQSESVVIQQKGLVKMSVAPITTREHAESLFGAATREHVNVYNWSSFSLDATFWRAGPISDWRQHSGEDTLCFVQATQWGRPWWWGVGEPPKSVSMGEADPATHPLLGSMRAEVIPHPLHLGQSGKLSTGL